MPTIFLSYSQNDFEHAARVEQQLTFQGLTVWRDQEQLRTGQRWPKMLGEAIAGSDALLLLWSAEAAQSNFVELEWTTALALKKQVLPCLIDGTPLPPSLAAIQSVPISTISGVASTISASLSEETAVANQANTQNVMRELASIDTLEPTDVLNKFKAAVAQHEWKVQGSVYQASGDINIGAAPLPKTRLETWQAWVAIIAGILTVTSLGIALVHSYAPVFTRSQVQEQTLAGVIWSDAGEPLTSATVSVLLDGKLVASGMTDAIGHYSFHVSAAPEAEITLIAQKDGYQTEKRYTHLGDSNFSFKMSGRAH